MTENEIVNRINEMAIESLDPDTFEKWECVLSILRKTRRALGFNACAPLSLSDVRLGVEEFLDHVEEHPDRVFFVTRIGCGVAGFADKEIAPLFRDAPENCDLPTNWRI
jgi:hypothetical protein